MFGTLMDIIGTPFGWLMWAIYALIKNYWVTILIFTVFTKIILFPVSLKVQKNSVQMVQLQPLLNRARVAFAGDKDRIAEAELQIYKENHYSPAMGCLPTLIQVPIVLGLINVIYNPLRHLLHLDSATIQQLVAAAGQMLGKPELGTAAQLNVVELVQSAQYGPAFASLTGIADLPAVLAQINALDMNFFGLNLAATPTLVPLTALVLIPLFSGLTTLWMCVVQNRQNVLQVEQGALSKYGVTIFVIAFSVYFAFVVPAGVGLYWCFSNILAALLVYLLNMVYDPKKYINYEDKAEAERLLAQQKALDKAEKERLAASRGKEKADYKRFFQIEDKHIVFYSEKSGFYKYYSTLINALLARCDYTIYYVTNDPDDVVFTLDNPRVQGFYIGPKRIIPFMMKLEADIVVMTTPDLEIFHIKRSLVQKDIEYIYIDHGIINAMATLREHALDHFDTMFCVGPHQKAEYLETEQMYGLAPRTLVEAGYGMLEEITAAYEAMPKVRHERPQILIAPSYQDDNILDLCLDDLLSGMLGHGYHIIVRPHPEYVKRFRPKMDAILERYKDADPEELEFQLDFSSNATIYESDLIVTDWSGIAQEFAYATKKPVMYVDTPQKVLNPNYTLYSFPPLEVQQRNEIGRALAVDQLADAHKTVDYLLAHGAEYEKTIGALRDKCIYNFGNSGPVGADYIIGQIKKRQAQAEEAAE